MYIGPNDTHRTAFICRNYIVSIKLLYSSLAVQRCGILRAPYCFRVLSRLVRPGVLLAQTPQPVEETFSHHHRYQGDCFLDRFHRLTADLLPTTYDYLTRRLF